MHQPASIQGGQTLLFQEKQVKCINGQTVKHII